MRTIGTPSRKSIHVQPLPQGESTDELDGLLLPAVVRNIDENQLAISVDEVKRRVADVVEYKLRPPLANQ